MLKISRKCNVQKIIKAVNEISTVENVQKPEEVITKMLNKNDNIKIHLLPQHILENNKITKLFERTFDKDGSREIVRVSSYPNKKEKPYVIALIDIPESKEVLIERGGENYYKSFLEWSTTSLMKEIVGIYIHANPNNQYSEGCIRFIKEFVAMKILSSINHPMAYDMSKLDYYYKWLLENEKDFLKSDFIKDINHYYQEIIAL